MKSFKLISLTLLFAGSVIIAPKAEVKNLVKQENKSVVQQEIKSGWTFNYFDFLPGESKTIHVTTKLSKAEFDKQLKSISISDAY